MPEDGLITGRNMLHTFEGNLVDYDKPVLSLQNKRVFFLTVNTTEWLP